MFKIDKSSVDYLDEGKSIIVNPLSSSQKGMEGSFDEEAGNASDELLKSARFEASKIIADATLKADQIRNEAWQKGFTEGKAEASSQTEKNKNSYNTRLRILISYLKEYRNSLEAEFESDILQLSFCIAEKIVNISLENNDIVFEQLLKQIVRDYTSSERFVVRVHPEEYERFFKEDRDWLSTALNCAPFTVVADASLEKGGLVLETSEGIIDAGLLTQLNSLKGTLCVNGAEHD